MMMPLDNDTKLGHGSKGQAKKFGSASNELNSSLSNIVFPEVKPHSFFDTELKLTPIEKTGKTHSDESMKTKTPKSELGKRHSLKLSNKLDHDSNSNSNSTNEGSKKKQSSTSTIISHFASLFDSKKKKVKIPAVTLQTIKSIYFQDLVDSQQGKNIKGGLCISTTEMQNKLKTNDNNSSRSRAIRENSWQTESTLRNIIATDLIYKNNIPAMELTQEVQAIIDTYLAPAFADFIEKNPESASCQTFPNSVIKWLEVALGTVRVLEVKPLRTDQVFGCYFYSSDLDREAYVLAFAMTECFKFYEASYKQHADVYQFMKTYLNERKLLGHDNQTLLDGYKKAVENLPQKIIPALQNCKNSDEEKIKKEIADEENFISLNSLLKQAELAEKIRAGLREKITEIKFTETKKNFPTHIHRTSSGTEEIYFKKESDLLRDVTQLLEASFKNVGKENDHVIVIPNQTVKVKQFVEVLVEKLIPKKEIFSPGEYEKLTTPRISPK